MKTRNSDDGAGCYLYVLAVFVLAFFISHSMCAQNGYNWKRAIAPASLGFASGAAWGLNQTLEHHNDRFFRVFPNASKRFWGPESWKNKYNGFAPENGRNGTPIWVTDGKHLTASITQVTAFGAGVCIGIGDKRKWWHYALDAGISFAAYTAGNLLTYNLIFRE